MADEEMDEELFVTGRGKASAGKKRQRKADDSDDEGAAAGKRKPAAADSDDDEYGLDEEERAKLESMNELEREMYLFEKQEVLQRQRERQQVLAQAKAKESEQVGAAKWAWCGVTRVTLNNNQSTLATRGCRGCRPHVCSRPCPGGPPCRPSMCSRHGRVVIIRQLLRTWARGAAEHKHSHQSRVQLKRPLCFPA